MGTISYEELEASRDDVTLIDVREENEVSQYGRIPGSHNIPVTELSSAVKLEDEVFQSKYGFPKPSQDEALVTHCVRGMRAQKAQMILQMQGFNNVRCYVGSFEDWKENGGSVEQV